MKKITFLVAMLFLAVFSSFAQSNQEEIELFQSVFGMEKKAIINEFVQVNGEASVAFWNLYDKYESERKAHGQKRLDLLSTYADNYSNLDDESTEEIMSEMISLGKEYDKLIHSYYKSIKKACGVKPAAQFFQLEVYFQSAIRKVIFENIPFIGELDE